MPSVDQAEAVTEIHRLLQTEPDIVAAAVSGSIAHGDADRWSDIDLSAYANSDRIETLWDSRRALLSRLRALAFLVDISHIVPRSAIGFYRDGLRIHITYKSIDEFDLNSTSELILYGRPVSTILPDPPTVTTQEYGAQMFAFWLNRAWVGFNRTDELQQLESFLRLLEIYLAHLAHVRQKRFFGLRKVDGYVTEAEAKWVRDCLHLAGRHQPSEAVLMVADRYLNANTLATTASPDEVAAEDYARTLAVRLRNEVSEA